jgi:hypothetical protein
VPVQRDEGGVVWARGNGLSVVNLAVENIAINQATSRDMGKPVSNQWLRWCPHEM